MKKVRLIAVIVAVLAAIILYGFLNRANPQEAPQIKTVDIVVAAADVPQNTVLTVDHLRMKAIPEDMVMEGSFRTIQDLVGKLTRVDLVSGEQIVTERVSDIGTRGAATLDLMIEEGMRAITIPVNTVTGIHNMIHPGDYVDLIAHIEQEVEEEETEPTEPPAEGEEAEPTEEPETEMEMVSVALAENIVVLAVDQVISELGSANGYTTVTLMVTPEQVTQIDWAVNRGVVRLVLRTPLDEQAEGLNKIGVTNILGEEETATGGAVG